MTIPEDLSFLSTVQELNLSANLFASNSTIVKADKIFYSLGQMPNLKKLNLSRNKFTGFHSAELHENSFAQLQELDISYNIVDQ